MGLGSRGLLVLLGVPASGVCSILVCGHLRLRAALRYSARLVAYWRAAHRSCLVHPGHPVRASRLRGCGRLVLAVDLRLPPLVVGRLGHQGL